MGVSGLTATDLFFAYEPGRPVLCGVSLSVPPHARVGILGPNGSGKTTLLRLLAGTRAPQRGAVTLDGRPVRELPRAVLARRMAVVPQETQLAFDYTASEVVMMGRYPHLGTFAVEGPGDLAIVEECMRATGTHEFAGRPFAHLSGGEKQRVVIASALAQIAGSAASDSGILLLDEPTASLDLGYQLEVAALLTSLHAERDLALVLSTHDLSLAASLCETLVLMRGGAVVATGRVDDVLTPANIRTVYGVDAEVVAHDSGQRLIVPVRRR